MTVDEVVSLVGPCPCPCPSSRRGAGRAGKRSGRPGTTRQGFGRGGGTRSDRCLSTRARARALRREGRESGRAGRSIRKQSAIADRQLAFLLFLSSDRLPSERVCVCCYESTRSRPRHHREQQSSYVTDLSRFLPSIYRTPLLMRSVHPNQLGRHELGESRCRLIDEIVELAILDDLASVDHDDPVGLSDR